ncbi:hypothetical protein HYALB_00005636 [Hymenoscyphus albidus]|uniref:Uncharacterized protein n=1 Tax=Hymenoscyphus albidus TaxID=595503 RepID=A0A9N9PUI1_9HELO|nr:hypothetical protein HYALB_00005636 [Hymenoscyphus albidus]
MLCQMRKDMEAKNDGKNGKNGKTGDENEDGEIKFGVANVYKLTRRIMRCDQEICTGFSQEGEELYNEPGDYTTLFRNHFAAPLLSRLRNSSRTSNHDGTPM